MLTDGADTPETDTSAAGQPPQRLTEDEIAAIVANLGNTAAVLAVADPTDKAKIYSGLGLHLTYEPGRKP